MEKYIFSQIRYETGAVMVLHKDHSFLEQFGPKERRRNFNYRAVPGMPQCEVTGLMAEVSQQEGDTAPNAVQPVLTFNPLRKPKGEIIHEKYCVIHTEDLWHLIVTRTLLPQIQGSGNVWYGASWCNWIGHASAIDAGMVIATRLGANMAIETEHARNVYFDMAVRDMFGYRPDLLGTRFDWRSSARERKPVLRSAL